MYSGNANLLGRAKFVVIPKRFFQAAYILFKNAMPDLLPFPCSQCSNYTQFAMSLSKQNTTSNRK